jgi:hypothetical protein
VTRGKGKTVVKRLGLGLALLLVLAACGDDDAPATVALPAGASALGLETYAGDGFLMLLPESWVVVTADDLDVGAMLEYLPEGFDEALGPEMLEQIEGLFSQGGKLIAFDFSSPSLEFTDNLNIIEAPLPPVSIAVAESANVQYIKEVFGVTDIESEIRSLPAGEAFIIRYTLPPALGSTQGMVVNILAEAKHWAFTLSATDVDRHLEAFELMVESFRENP